MCLMEVMEKGFDGTTAVIMETVVVVDGVEVL